MRRKMLINKIARRRDFDFPEIEFGLESIVNTLGFANFAPELRVRPLCQAVMHIDEIEDFVVAIGHDAVVTVGERCHVVIEWEMLGEHDRCQATEIQVGRLQRFDETA